MFCEKCGSVIEDGSSFCSNCGTRFDDIDLSANDATVPISEPNPTPMVYNTEPLPRKKSGFGAVLGLVVAVVVAVGIVFAAVHFIGGGAKKSDNPSLAIAQQMYKDLNKEAKKLKRKNGSYPDSDDLVAAMKNYSYGDYGYEAFGAITDYDDGEISMIVIIGAEDVTEAMDDVKSAAKRGNLKKLESYVKAYKTDSWEELDVDDLVDELEDMSDDIDDPEDALELFPIEYVCSSSWIDLPSLIGE